MEKTFPSLIRLGKISPYDPQSAGSLRLRVKNCCWVRVWVCVLVCVWVWVCVCVCVCVYDEAGQQLK